MSDPLTIIHGYALSSLRELPSESVQTCVTSPPYWGLRSYGTDPIVWDNHNGCEHEWSAEPSTKMRWGGANGVSDKQKSNSGTVGPMDSLERGGLCKCGAWRGELGLEPTPELYVQHLVEIFREARRVLRNDGTVFLNLGDSYFGGGGHSPNAPSSATSKSGKYGATGALIKGHTSGGALRAAPYGTFDKALEDSLVSDCLCQSLCDACRVAYQTGKSHSGRWPDPTPSALPSAPIRARMESVLDRSPTSDSSLPAGRIADATQGFESCVGLERGRLLASQASMIGESSLPRPESYLPNENLDGECRLCGCSLRGSSQVSERKTACTCGTAQMFSSLGDRSHKDCNDDPYQDYTIVSRYLKPKDLVGIPWTVAFALRADDWYLRSDIIWSKPNPMPESVTDRPTKSHEYIFLLSKSGKYHYDAEAIKEPGSFNLPWSENSNGGAKAEFIRHDGGNGLGKPARRTDRQRGHGRRHAGFNDRWDAMEREQQCSGTRNKRSVWEIATRPFPDAHFATFPPDLIRPCILAGAPVGGVVLDPFAGSGTTGKVAIELGRRAILIEPKAEYIEMIKRRCQTTMGFQFA